MKSGWTLRVENEVLEIPAVWVWGGEVVVKLRDGTLTKVWSRSGRCNECVVDDGLVEEVKMWMWQRVF